MIGTPKRRSSLIPKASSQRPRQSSDVSEGSWTRSEVLVSDWLTRQGCHWIYVEQSRFHKADGAKRSKPNQQINRPDFIALMDGFGTVAIDVKEYTYQKGSAPLHAKDEEGNDVKLMLQTPWVRLAWSDIIGLFEFQRVSNIPAWLCVIDNDSGQGETSSWFRVDKLYTSFSRLFLVNEIDFYSRNEKTLCYFEGWEEITLKPHPDVQDSRDTFQVIVENPDHIAIMEMTPIGSKIYVPPVILNLQNNTSLLDLVNIWPAMPRDPAEASIAQIIYAKAIAKALQLELPMSTSKIDVGSFIGKHKDRFRSGAVSD